MIAAVLIAAICSASAAYGRDKPGQESSCVEMLLRPPKPAKNFFISHPGRYANSQGKEGQDILMTLKYGAVEGCDNLERLPFLRLQEKRSGSSWFFPHKRFWIPFPLGHGKSNDPGEFALSGLPKAQYSCDVREWRPASLSRPSASPRAHSRHSEGAGNQSHNRVPDSVQTCESRALLTVTAPEFRVGAIVAEEGGQAALRRDLESTWTPARGSPSSSPRSQGRTVATHRTEPSKKLWQPNLGRPVFCPACRIGRPTPTWATSGGCESPGRATSKLPISHRRRERH